MDGPRPVVIAGGGLAGLACAVALTDAGFKVALYEASARFGGRAQSLRDEVSGDIVDIGPHVLTSDHRNMLAWLERLGSSDAVCWQPETFITLVDNGGSVKMHNYRLPAPLHFLPNFFRVDRLSLGDIWSSRRVLWRVMQMSEADVLALDECDAASVLREAGVSSRFIDWFWRTVCLAVLNVPLEQCSAASLYRFLKMLSGRADFHFGFPRRGLADLYLPAALNALQSGGASVACGVGIQRVLTRDRHVAGVELDDGRRIETDACVLAVPPAALAQIGMRSLALRDLLPDMNFAPSAYISVYLWFDRKLTRERFWARVWSPVNLNCDFYDLSNIRDGLEGSLIASNIIHSQRCDDLSDKEIVQLTRRELSDYLPAAANAMLLHARVHRIAMAIAAPHPGFESRRPFTRTPLDGLYLAGDWVRTAVPESMESAVRAGFLAAEAVAAAKGRQLHLALPLKPMRGFAGWLRRQAESGVHG